MCLTLLERKLQVKQSNINLILFVKEDKTYTTGTILDRQKKTNSKTKLILLLHEFHLFLPPFTCPNKSRQAGDKLERHYTFNKGL